ncbi:MAG TPA: WD40 repeat domain-containing protein [Aggregatilineales bacterium]|nr:WD40 repeat domain-containing protein [Aggregatilineales bacterium]
MMRIGPGNLPLHRLITGILAALMLMQPAVVHGQGSSRTIPVAFNAYHTALAPDGKTIAVAADCRIYGTSDVVDPLLLPIELIDLASGKITQTLTGPQTDCVTSLAFSPDGSGLLSSHDNGQLNLWESASGKLLKSYQMPGFGLRNPEFFTDGKHVALLSAGSVVPIWIVDTETGYITASYGPTFKTFGSYSSSYTKFPAGGDVRFTTFELSPDGKTIATANYNDEIDLWDVATGKMTVLFQPADKKVDLAIPALRFTEDGKSLVYYHSQSGKLHVWDLAAKKEQNIALTGGASFALNSRGDTVAWIFKSQVFTWDFQAEQATKVGDLDTALHVQPTSVLYFTPDGKQLIVANLAAISEMEGKNQMYVISLPAAS